MQRCGWLHWCTGLGRDSAVSGFLYQFPLEPKERCSSVIPSTFRLTREITSGARVVILSLSTGIDRTEPFRSTAMSTCCLFVPLEREEMAHVATSCSRCGKKLFENDVYTYEGKPMCDDCAMKAGLFPLEHSGSRRDKISERGRRLTIPKP